MSEKQQLMWLKAFKAIADGQVREAYRPRAPRTQSSEGGFVRHINCSVDCLSEEARRVYENGRAANEEEYKAILPFLKSVPITRVEPLARGRTWSGKGGSKEAQRAAKRLAAKEGVHES